jgi:hypothetical protein
MVRRATDETGSGSAAYQRMAQREEEARAAMNDRLESALDHIITELGDIRTDVRRLEEGGATLANRIADIERQIINTRDEVQKRSAVSSPAQIASAKTAIRDAVKSPWGRVVAFAVGFVAIVSALENLPDAARAMERFWHFLTGRDVSALQVVAPTAQAAPVPEK